MELKDHAGEFNECLSAWVAASGDTVGLEMRLSSLQLDMSRGLLYCEANPKWQSENNMVGIEGMKDGSQLERDRPVISQSTPLTLLSVSLRKTWAKTNKQASKQQKINAVICYTYFNHKAGDYTSLGKPTKLW